MPFNGILELIQPSKTSRRRLLKPPVLRLPDFTQTFVIETDASAMGMGAVLMQEGRPLAYISKAFSIRNRGLSVYEKELLALVLAVEKWRHYLIGHHFVIKTDHQSLKFLLDQKLHHSLQSFIDLPDNRLRTS